MGQDEKIQEILNYWFGETLEGGAVGPERQRLWFEKVPDVDKEITSKFQGDLEKAKSGDYSAWSQEPAGCSALILLLDQLGWLEGENLILKILNFLY